MTLLQRIEHAYNWIRGCRFFWVETPGSPAGGYLDATEKCCPYPLLFDWSVKACNKAGLCGCNKGRALGDIHSSEPK